MDTMLFVDARHCPSQPKRPCCGSYTNPSTGIVPNDSRVSKHVGMDELLESLLGFSDSTFFELPLERLLESKACESEKNRLIESALSLGTKLQEAAKRSARKRASFHNSITWCLPQDLTVKVFSMLDTRSLCHAAATCSMFYSCAMDPMCYANVDLTSTVPKANNTVVFAMIKRAGKYFQSLKLGILPVPIETTAYYRPMVDSSQNAADSSVSSWHERKTRPGKDLNVLTRSCLMILGSGAAGALLRRLHLYNIDKMDTSSLCIALSHCPSLLDLEVVGLYVELRQTLTSISKHCHSVERLFFESSKAGRDESLKTSTCSDLVNGCPNLSSLALRGYKLSDQKVRTLFKGLRKLKFVDLSAAYLITGMFLRNLGNGTNDHLLEVLILRDCMHLKEVEVDNFLLAVLAGECKFLRHLDISNKDGLAAEEDWFHRCYSPSSVPISRVLEGRPDICLVADFPSDKRFFEVDHLLESELNSDDSLPTQISNPSSDSSLLMSSSDGSYSSDHGSGNEDGLAAAYAIYEEFSDGIEYLVVS